MGRTKVFSLCDSLGRRNEGIRLLLHSPQREAGLRRSDYAVGDERSVRRRPREAVDPGNEGVAGVRVAVQEAGVAGARDSHVRMARAPRRTAEVITSSVWNLRTNRSIDSPVEPVRIGRMRRANG